MSNAFIFSLINYIFASIVGLAILVYLFKKREYKNAIIGIIIYLTLVQTGMGVKLYKDKQAGVFNLTNELVGTTFDLADPVNGGIQQLSFDDAQTVTITDNNGVVDSPYQLTGADSFYISKNYNGQVTNGKITQKHGKLLITITSPSGTRYFKQTEN